MENSKKYEKLIINGPREFMLYDKKYHGEYVIIDAAEDWSDDRVDGNVTHFEYYYNPPEEEDLVAYYGFYDDGSQTKLYVRIDDKEEAEAVIRLYKQIDVPVPIWNHAKAIYTTDEGNELVVWNLDGAKWHIPKERYGDKEG